MRLSVLYHYSAKGGHALTYMDNPFFCFSLHGQRPPSQDSCSPRQVGKPFLATKCHHCPHSLLRCRPFLTELMEHNSIQKGKSPAIRVREFPSQSQCFANPLSGLIRITKIP